MDKPESAIISRTEHKTFPVLKIQGYFEEDSGIQLNQLVEVELQKGRFLIIIDFSECSVVNSLGLAQIVEAVDKVHLDYQGKIVFSGLKPIFKQALTLACIIPTATPVANLDEAVKVLQAAKSP